MHFLAPTPYFPRSPSTFINIWSVIRLFWHKYPQPGTQSHCFYLCRQCPSLYVFMQLLYLQKYSYHFFLRIFRYRGVKSQYIISFQICIDKKSLKQCITYLLFLYDGADLKGLVICIFQIWSRSGRTIPNDSMNPISQSYAETC